MSDRIKSFDEFWPYYVLEHSKKVNRALHFIGTSAAVTTLGIAAVRRKPALIPLALVAGYGPAWIGHFFVEGNKPATFKYPLWSLLADFKMWSKIARGKMQREIERAQAKRDKAAQEVTAPPADNYAVN
ncbi:MAG: DUF962 domain-containing protein [Myxococcales bacterium]|nr:DUF962 domain-containing protein [Myxococcales bacterium]